MKYVIILLVALMAASSAKSQGFPGTDSLRGYNSKYITTNPATAFTNNRLHTLLRGIIDWIDTARSGTGGGGAVGVDTLWALNDSTIRYRKNGVFRNEILKGVYDTRRKVDTAYAVNDTTLRITINGQIRNIIIGGRAPVLTNAGGAGDTLLTAANTIKRIDSDNTIVRSTNGTKILLSVDTISWVASIPRLRDTAATLRALIEDAGGNIQQTLTLGDSSLRAIIYKDTASNLETNDFLIEKVIPRNYDTVYTNGEGGLFSRSIAKFTGVNVDGRPNVVGNFWAYNVAPNGGRLNTNEAGFRFGTETHYQLGVGNNPAFELHLPEVTTNSGVVFRPLSMYILKSSGLTNTDMQITQMSWLKQLDANVAWGRFSYGGDGTIFNQIAESDTMRHQHIFTLPGSIGELNYDNTGFQLTSNIVGAKIFNTNMSIAYGDPSNLSGMDGYGNVTHREAEVLIENTGANTSFFEANHNFTPKYNFTSASALFYPEVILNGPLTMVGSNNIITGNGVIYPGSSGAMTFSSAGPTLGDIRWQNGSVGGARTMTLFTGTGSTNTNLNIGPATANPGYRLQVQGNAKIDSGLVLHNITGPPSSYNILVHGLTDSATYQVPTSIFTRTIDALITTAQNSGTSETDLFTKTIAANTLTTDKQTLNFEIDGEFNDNTATAQLKLYFAGNVTLNTGAINISTAFTAWRLKGYIIRTSSSTAHVTYELHAPGLATPVFVGYNNLTSLDFTTTNIIKISAQAGGAGGGNGDITAHSWQVTYKPAP